MVHDFVWQDGQVTVSPVSGAAGPVEEFSTIGFDEAGDGGPLPEDRRRHHEAHQPQTYDFVHAYPVLNEGTRSYSATKTSVRLTHDLADKETGWGYSYAKTVRLVPGKPQMVIEHVLKNTGKKDDRHGRLLPQLPDLGDGQRRMSPSPRPSTSRPTSPFAPDAAAVEGQDPEVPARDQGK